jgi:hypothetical protein
MREGRAAEINAWVAEACGLMSSPAGLCEDCGMPSDLGRKCRGCYSQWSRLLWQDAPRQHALLLGTCRRLLEQPWGSQRAIADVAAGRGRSGLTGREAEIYGDVRKVLAGPFEPSLEHLLKAIRNSNGSETVGTKKRRGNREDLS